MRPDPFIDLLAPSKGERILDIGAGTGQVADRVLRASNGAEVHAVDPNEKRVASMKRKFQAIKSSVAGAEKLPFPDSYFDKAYTTMALHHYSDLDAALAEVARVLKAGGRFIVLEIDPNSGKGMVFRLFGRLMKEHMGMMGEQELLARLGRAEGFSVVSSTKLGSSYLVQLARR